MTVVLTSSSSRSDPSAVLVLIEASDRDSLFTALLLLSRQHIETRYTEPVELESGSWATLARCSPP